MRRTKSLLSIHLCMNPGSTARVKEYLLKRIRCMPIQQTIKFPVGDIINSMSKISARTIMQRQLITGMEQSGEKPIARETIKIK